MSRERSFDLDRHPPISLLELLRGRFCPQNLRLGGGESKFLEKIHWKRFQKIENAATIWPVEFFKPPNPRTMATVCKHPKVRVVSRHEDTEYVECMECGDVFDSEEFRDMEIEDAAESEPSLED
jgi:hypothetical protein